MAYQTRSTYKLPLYSPNLERWQPHQYFPHPRLPLLTGLYARVAWHSVRAALYAGTGYIGARIFFTGYAMHTCVVGAAMDPRGEAIREASKKPNRGPIAIMPLVIRFPGTPGQKDQRQSGFDEGNAPDSPEDNFASNNDAQSQSVYPGTQMERDTTQSSTYGNEPYNSPQTPTNRTQPTQVRPTPTPTAAFPSPSPSTSGSSTWEKIRQQSTGGAGGASGRASKPASQTKPEFPEERENYDTYAPKSEDDTQAAREKAQREFDERIEQERRGGDFNSGREGFKRW